LAPATANSLQWFGGSVRSPPTNRDGIPLLLPTVARDDPSMRRKAMTQRAWE
jgi:hypothetical protein